MTACKAVSSKGICLITVTETILMRLRVGLLADSVLTWQLHQKFLSTLEGDTFRAGAGYHQLLTAVARNTRADSTIDNEANAYDGDGQLSLQQQHEYEAGSVASLLAGGERLPTDQLPGSKRRKALAPLSPPAPLIFSPSLAGHHSAPPLPPAPQQRPHPAQLTAQAHVAAPSAPQPQLAPIFQKPAAAASGQKRLRDRSLGKGSNHGTERGGKGVAKTCQACSIIQNTPVQLTRAHQNSCVFCTKCVVKSKGKIHQLKMVDDVPHDCPYK
ncbi:hypothetical protein ABBQ32_006569 [Trebouxia sp. C0010 RCD-2024]